MVPKAKKLGIKIIVALLLTCGIVIIVYGSWQLIDSKMAQAKALDIAKSNVLSESPVPVNANKDYPITYQYEKGEVFGVLLIPSIEAELPIIEGTDQEELKKGVGHYIGSAYPTQQDQIVLSGHRETVFQNLGDLVVGDQIIIEMPDAAYSYEVTSTDIVDAADRNVIRSTAPDELLTLTTCYPFNFIGDAPERYIIYAKPVQSNLVAAE
ncbi:class D sortase [Ornithinibacillus contaminans]|uniref:class D sortase n=1 Tax=Ornithinibacillus contaminans TaxID=694055 RepID=UPI00064DF846|nr:class D sortase [Ornithinibacillus contaminans]